MWQSGFTFAIATNATSARRSPGTRAFADASFDAASANFLKSSLFGSLLSVKSGIETMSARPPAFWTSSFIAWSAAVRTSLLVGAKTSSSVNPL